MFKTPRVSSLIVGAKLEILFVIYIFSLRIKYFSFSLQVLEDGGCGGLGSPRMYDSTINQYIQQKAAFIMLEDLGGSDLTANNPESIYF